MDLRDSIAIVTGASSGIGRAFSEHLVRAGATVYGFARGIDRLKDTAKALGSAFHPEQCDVRDADRVVEVIDRIGRETGRIDILINNAGIGKNAPIDDISSDAWDDVQETNVRGVFLCTQAVVPHMRNQNAEGGFGGHIINIASIAGLLGNPNLSAYNASKFAVRGFSEAMMKELRNDGIKVTCIYPGSIATNFRFGPGSANRPMTSEDIAGTVMHVLQTSDNYLISEVVMRPLRPHA